MKTIMIFIFRFFLITDLKLFDPFTICGVQLENNHFTLFSMQSLLICSYKIFLYAAYMLTKFL